MQTETTTTIDLTKLSSPEFFRKLVIRGVEIKGPTASCGVTNWLITQKQLVNPLTIKRLMVELRDQGYLSAKVAEEPMPNGSRPLLFTVTEKGREYARTD